VTAEQVLQAFMGALHDGDLESAYQMLSDDARSGQSLDQFAAMVQGMREATSAIETYEGLEVCSFEVVVSDGARGIVAPGFLRYDAGYVYFESLVCQDSDGEWRILTFHADPGIEATPGGPARPTEDLPGLDCLRPTDAH